MREQKWFCLSVALAALLTGAVVLTLLQYHIMAAPLESMFFLLTAGSGLFILSGFLSAPQGKDDRHCRLTAILGGIGTVFFSCILGLLANAASAAYLILVALTMAMEVLALGGVLGYFIHRAR